MRRRLRTQPSTEMLAGYAAGAAHSSCRRVRQLRKENWALMEKFFMELYRHALKCRKTCAADREMLQKALQAAKAVKP